MITSCSRPRGWLPATAGALACALVLALWVDTAWASVFTNPGIPAAERARLFERFETMPHDAWLPSKGVGLGLHIVKLYTEMLGGSIRVEDRPSGGTIFTVSIPEA